MDDWSQENRENWAKQQFANISLFNLCDNETRILIAVKCIQMENWNAGSVKNSFAAETDDQS